MKLRNLTPLAVAIAVALPGLVRAQTAPTTTQVVTDMLAAFGSGTYVDGTYTAPSFTLPSGTFGSVQAALSALGTTSGAANDDVQTLTETLSAWMGAGADLAVDTSPGVPPGSMTGSGPTFVLSNPFSVGSFSTVGGAVAALDQGLATAADDISANDDSIGVNTSAIGANTSSIAANAKSINLNADNIGMNTSELSGLNNAVGAAMGGGFVCALGSCTAPSFVLKNPYSAGTYTSVGGALQALDTAVSDVPTGDAGASAGTHDFGVSNPSATASTDSNYTGGGAQGATSVAIGPSATAAVTGDLAVGNAAYAAGANGASAIALGDLAEAAAGGAAAVGDDAFAGGTNSTAIGNLATATASDSTALGQDAVADQADTVSVGSDGADGIAAFQSRIVNVGSGVGSFDAVNVGQFNAGGQAIAAWIGGGAAFNGAGAGAFTSPTFTLTNPYTHGTYTSVGGALQALDTGLTDQAKAGGTGTGTGVTGPRGPQGPAGKNGVGVVQFTDASHAAARVGTANAGPEQAKTPVVLQNVAAGTTGTDAANVAQVQQGDAQTLKDANAYTDTHAVEYVPHSDPIVALRPNTTLEDVAAGTQPTDAVNVAQLRASQAASENWARSYTNYVGQQALTDAEHYTNALGAVLNRRIDYALSSAMADSQAAAALAGQSRGEPNRVAVGVGDTAGVSAMNVTYQHLIPGSHWAFNLGASVSASGGEQGTTVGGGVSYGW